MEVKFGLVRTIQTKLNESVRIEFSVETDCDDNLDDADFTYKKISKFVRDKIEEEENRWV